MTRRWAVGIVVCASLPVAARAQDPAWDAWVLHTDAPIRLDGSLAEAVWLTADSITAFTQSDPVEGQTGTERTVVRLLAGPDGLWVGVWAYDSEPDAIRHAQLRRDADFGSDDSFTLLLDPLRDRRTAFLFTVNPNGAMADAQVINYETINLDWNGVWDARARLTSFGWTAELFIPWHTLRYEPRNDVWGVNFERLVRRKNEDVLWRAWRRTEGILFLPHEGLVAGFTGLPRRTPAELRPYSAATGQARELRYPPEGPDSVLSLGSAGLKVGLDAKLAPAPTLTLDLTAHTDFAQVEADSQVINLTRFPILFPEKRPFFLESSGTFSFGQFGSELFYSRRIGLDTLGNPIPLDAGVRLTGRLGADQIGLLGVRTGGLERATDLVARVKHDVFSRGYVGAIVTNQTAPGVRGDRLAGGMDFSFPLYVRDQNLVFAAWGAGSREGVGTVAGSAWRVSIDFPNDLMDHFVSLGRVEANFSPPLGFVSETDILRTSGHFDFYPRPHALGVRRLQFSLLRWEHTTHLDGSPSHALYEVAPLGAIFESGDQFILILRRQEDAPPTPFEIFRGQTIAPGDYFFNRAELDLTTSPGRPMSVDVTASAGNYYTGTATDVDATVTVRGAPHVITQVEYDQLAARLAIARFTARTARLRLDLAATPRFDTAFFLQWDDESDRLNMNARLHWIPNLGSDAYLVWNSAWPTGLAAGMLWGRPARGALIGKLVYYFRL
ncbi:MAG TPA: DUF5916 domain-containing protein [Gemmatimonadales bacterium]|nr:DUF5916 domain-containing protein [Gemmatimonadales bacterium]